MKVYFIKIALHGVSPMIWRRLCVPGTANDDADTVYIDDFDFDIGDKFTYEYNFFEHTMHDIRIEKVKDLSSLKNIISCVSGSGMPGATKYDAMHIELSMLKKIVEQKGNVSYADIEKFQENINRVKFNKKHINKALEALIRT